MAVYKAPDIQRIITQRNQALMNKTVLFFFPPLTHAPQTNTKI